MFTFELTDDAEPEGGIEFNFCRRDKHRAVATVHTTETPEDEAEAAVWVETEGDVAGGVQLALAFHRVTQCSCRRVRHLNEKYTHQKQGRNY